MKKDKKSLKDQIDSNIVSVAVVLNPHCNDAAPPPAASPSPRPLLFFLVPPSLVAFQERFLGDVPHRVLLPEEAGGSHVHDSFAELVAADKFVELHFHLYVDGYFQGEDALLAQIVVDGGGLATHGAGQGKDEVPLFPTIASRRLAAGEPVQQVVEDAVAR